VLAAPPAARAPMIASLLEDWESGGIKLLVAAAGLRLRAAEAELFLKGEYLPLDVDTTVPGRIVSFARLLSGRAVVAVAPHLVVRLIDANRPAAIGDAWKTSRILLPAALASLTYRDAFTGNEIVPVRSADHAWFFVGQVLSTLPVALLISP
jgi:(1->4)-alpha-D-glucan 1-alpha-D-glucosylmutase